MNIDKRNRPIITITLDKEEAKMLAESLDILRTRNPPVVGLEPASMIQRISSTIFELLD